MTAVDVAAPDVAAPVPPPLPAASSPSDGRGVARFVGKEESYWRLMIRGAVFLLLTLGVYRFWLATDQRRFLWANTDIAGDNLEYTGTARELLIGFLIAIAVLVPIYVGLFAAALDSGLIGQLSWVIAFALLAVFGQFAIYRARRYRLTRTVFRGLRLHQTGSAWLYALYSTLWWIVTIVTFGLAYPWAQASLERFKMRNTFYGDVRGRFAGSGTILFLRGIVMWFLVVGPIVAGLFYAVRGINWTALAEAVDLGSDNVMDRIESVSPNFGAALAFVIFAFVWSFFAAALLYPAFQAMVLRWWTSGLRFGDITATSRLRTGQMYRLYLRFVGYSMLFGLLVGVAAGFVFGIFQALCQLIGDALFAEVSGIAGAVVTYVVVMLGYSTVYQVTVKLRMWRLSFETAEFAGLDALSGVKAAGAASSAFGEGLADALDVGGL
jgi:uncharacterized membrane protein YjgN (DUF898 family)